MDTRFGGGDSSCFPDLRARDFDGGEDEVEDDDGSVVAGFFLLDERG